MPDTRESEAVDSTGELDVASIPADESFQIEECSSQTLADNDTENIYALQLADDKHKRNVEKLQGLQQDREQRKEFAKKIYWLICLWLLGVAALLLLRGWNIWGFYLSETVLIALITTTSANVIGLLAIVILYLFPRKRR